MKINIRYSTIPMMLEICRKLKEGRFERAELEELLEHDDYRVEMERYNSSTSGFTKEEYLDFFENFFTLKEEDINNRILKVRYGQMKSFFDNLEYYEENYKKFHNVNEDNVKKALEYTHYGLPEKFMFKELDIIYSIGLGASGGWFHKHYSHYDVVQFLEGFNVSKIENIIAHEAHHIGLSKLFAELDMENITPEEYLYLFLSGEGLAVKYCNNGEGVLTRRIYDNEESNLGLHEESWTFLKEDFDNTFKQFKSQINMIRNNQIKDITELNKYLGEYWTSLHTPEQGKDEVPRLMHSRNYFFGCDVWGLIHDVYGREKVFELLENLKQFSAVFNSALEKIGREDLKI
ncbi:DUF5700 domain-containing putative Zn-dependent protease [Oceanirhabdus sp. W0125-5]|uniref:DUF5700 domain-containing putative Zn-dependent protease n=1 Tax=Oceanirhabdus sp. W0125-5 TaxID=2999116 RepID=UPI0022F30BEA|nr:DUF5700 domain-containing putative Zn-dependent protease [Oceanirhabdus sp. W0125-5]WBW96955.1 hypothetical protein OW730_25185 [Oceanirhabdus sp. W0125-5]